MPFGLIINFILWVFFFIYTKCNLHEKCFQICFVDWFVFEVQKKRGNVFEVYITK